jgi:hypothetical protein
MTEIALSWNGLPQYAARLIRGALDRLGSDCVVIGSRPSVPVEGMEKALDHPIYWIDAAKPTSWDSLGLNVPDVFVQSGWSYPAFSSLGAEVKAQGGRVIGLSDANWRGDFRQIVLGPIVFRAIHRRHFDGMIVPGRQGERLMRWFGMPAARVRCGMYGADPALFGGAGALALRPKTFLFVGQFIERKNVLLRRPAETTATIFSDAGGPCSSIQDGTCRRGCREPPFRRLRSGATFRLSKCLSGEFLNRMNRL